MPSDLAKWWWAIPGSNQSVEAPPLGGLTQLLTQVWRAGVPARGFGPTLRVPDGCAADLDPQCATRRCQSHLATELVMTGSAVGAPSPMRVRALYSSEDHCDIAG